MQRRLSARPAAQRFDLHREQHHRAQSGAGRDVPRQDRPPGPWRACRSREFKKRQHLHREAEIGAMRDVAEFIVKAQEIYGYDHFINDAGGSLRRARRRADRARRSPTHTLILYLKARPGARASSSCSARSMTRSRSTTRSSFWTRSSRSTSPKPSSTASGQIVPDEFVRWIFPALVAHRRPAIRSARGALRLHVQRAARRSDHGRAGLPRVRRERARLNGAHVDGQSDRTRDPTIQAPTSASTAIAGANVLRSRR